MDETAAVLIAAHVIGDFLLQPAVLVERKSKPSYLALHAAIHGGLVYLILQQWTAWQPVLFVSISHAIIDATKEHWSSDSARAFVIDQALHIGSLVILAWLMCSTSWGHGYSGIGYQPLVLLAGAVATVYGAGHLIAKSIRKIVDENDLEVGGLKNGGRLIGQLERALIFLLIYIGQPAGIGFLVAAKSILRFEEARKQKLAEYVLIGTLMSFSLAIAITTLTLMALSR